MRHVAQMPDDPLCSNRHAASAFRYSDNRHFIRIELDSFQHQGLLGRVKFRPFLDQGRISPMLIELELYSLGLHTSMLSCSLLLRTFRNQEYAPLNSTFTETT